MPPKIGKWNAPTEAQKEIARLKRENKKLNKTIDAFLKEEEDMACKHRQVECLDCGKVYNP